MIGSLSDTIARIRDHIEKSCGRSGRESASVSVIAVTKGVETVKIQEAVAAGMRELGENRLQEAAGKIEALRDLPVRWHFIGRLQTNKMKKVVELFHSIQSLDAPKQVLVLQNQLDQGRKTAYPVLVQVNLSQASTQGGVEPDMLVPFLEFLRGMTRVKVDGLMTIAPFGGNELEIRGCFRRLRELLEMVNRQNTIGHPLRELSMGMSEDYTLAIEEGATIVRLGRALFGERSS